MPEFMGPWSLNWALGGEIGDIADAVAILYGFARYYYDTLRKEIYHEIKCKGDTVYYYKEIPYKVEKVVFKELSWWQQYKSIIYIILSVLIALFLLKRFKEYLPF